MSSSPFDIFRRNLKPLMVLLTGLAMFAFVVLPVLDSYMRRGASTGGDQVVAEFDGIQLTSSRIEYFTRNHNATVRFLRELAEQTIALGGQPRTAGFNYDSQTRRITSIGINESPSLQSTVRTLQFASLANEAGFALDDVAIQTWLQQFTNEMFSDSEINGLLMQSTRNQMGQYHLYEQLRTQLLADVYMQCAFANLSDGQMPLLTPAEQWASFLKLNREATVDAYGVLVNDFLSETNSDPGPAEIGAIYEQGKDRDPSDQSPEPAFHRRYTAKFEYLVGDYQTLLKEEIEKLTEEQLRAEYQRRLKGGDFELPEGASDDILRQMEAARAAAAAREAETSEGADAAAPGDEPATPADDPDESATTSDDTAAKPGEGGESAEEQATSQPDTTDESSAETAADPSSEETPAEESTETPGEESTETPGEESTETPGEESAETPGEQDQSQTDDRNTGVRLVALQNDEAPTQSDSTASQGDADDTEPAGDTPAAQTATEDPGDGTSESTAADPEAAQSDQPDEQETPTANDDDSGDAEPDPAGDTPQVETFEDVRDRIAEELAGPEARRRLDVAVQNLTSKMRRYFNERAIYTGNKEAGLDAQEPTPLDLKKLGEEAGFRYESIGPYDEISITREPISQSREVGTEGMSRGPGFAMMMYGFAGGMTPIPPQPLYVPLRTADDQAGKRYVSWKISETEARTPPLEEVSDEVVMYIRMKEARKLAIARAEELAKQASESGQPLADLIPEDKQDNLQEGLGPFSWLDQVGFQGATIGNVPELDSVGPEFMKAVFNTELQAYSAAMNQPQRVAYVVKPTSFEPSIEELRRRFKEPAGRMMATFIGGSENNAVIQGFYKEIDEKTGYTSNLQQ